MQEWIRREADELLAKLVEWRRDFHRHPELGFQEVRTAGIVAAHLQELGLEVSTGVGKTGVIAMVEPDEPQDNNETVMLRFDMDALPIHEETGLPFSSESPGVMHACGHDGHTAIGMGVAQLLTRHRQRAARTGQAGFSAGRGRIGRRACHELRTVRSTSRNRPRPTGCICGAGFHTIR